MKRFLKLISTILICFIMLPLIPTVHAEGVFGDVNGDGVLTTDDARLALRFASNIAKPTSAQKSAADIDGDGVVSVSDVNAILTDAVDIDTYITNLVKKGFPISYAEYLADLHLQYPEWEFQPFITGLDWATVLKEERTPHSQQLIENSVKSSFMCSCSSCKGVIQEASNWVSASEEAVAYYMDPRNFLTPEYIFQFESTAFDSSQTQAGIEAILKNTWMANSYITYVDALGNSKTYTENGSKVKYSAYILKTAKSTGMSAYYLASKIVQEVGGSSATAGGASGTNSPYNGIYNYYNIGAYTGVRDGLQWANGYLKAAKSVNMLNSASSSGTKVVTVPSGTELYYIKTSGDYYHVKATVSGKSYTGYVPKSSTSIYTSYGRPWDTPAKSIYYGAQYIYDGFSEYQFTGYLQKFNVNPKSPSLFDHEYMGNVRAAASEAYSSYKAYKSAGILETKKVFSIPVFKNMPNADLTREDAFKATKPVVTASATTSSVTMSWNEVAGADAYQIYKYNPTSQKYEKIYTTTSLSYTDTSVSQTVASKYRIRAYYKKPDGTVVYSSYYDAYEFLAAPNTPTGLKVGTVTETSVALSWSAVSGAKYVIYRYDNITCAYSKIGTSSTNSYTDKTVDSGTNYSYKVRAYVSCSQNIYSSYSSAVSTTTKGTATQKGIVTADLLNIRKSASLSAEMVVKAPQDTVVKVLGTSGDFYKVSFTLNGTTYTGYGHKDYIKLLGTAEACPYAEPTTTLSQGSSGESVKWLQWYLCKLGYLTSSDIDGDFGPTTLAAVKEFQKDKSLDVDGVVGSATRSALKSAYK